MQQVAPLPSKPFPPINISNTSDSFLLTGSHVNPSDELRSQTNSRPITAQQIFVSSNGQNFELIPKSSKHWKNNKISNLRYSYFYSCTRYVIFVHLTPRHTLVRFRNFGMFNNSVRSAIDSIQQFLCFVLDRHSTRRLHGFRSSVHFPEGNYFCNASS